ncbi:hypothetical protein [Cryptosporangium sp. NPDC048952]|uniref:hypothetical protein n=1 Tax=Cryptosporangium sp. NPDC048952 TaxID=3363961 RepID=UPI00371B8766
MTPPVVPSPSGRPAAHRDRLTAPAHHRSWLARRWARLVLAVFLGAVLVVVTLLVLALVVPACACADPLDGPTPPTASATP